MTSRASAFTEFDAFHLRWRTAMTAGAHDSALVADATGLAERLVDETDATGQGREYALIGALAHVVQVQQINGALAHIAQMTQTSNDMDDMSALIAATDALVSEMNALVNA